MAVFSKREPTHTLKLTRTAYVNMCIAAKEARLSPEEWGPRALHRQAVQEKKERDAAAYHDYCEDAPYRPTFEEWRKKTGLPSV